MLCLAPFTGRNTYEIDLQDGRAFNSDTEDPLQLGDLDDDFCDANPIRNRPLFFQRTSDENGEGEHVRKGTSTSRCSVV